MTKPSLIEKALRISVKAHHGMTRKGDGLPYILHPFAVSMKLMEHNFPAKVVAAGLVHDVLEDTDFPLARLEKELGRDVARIVATVTHDDSLPWEEKKLKYIENVRRGPAGARAVACADKIHNLESLYLAYVEHGPRIWKQFNQGKDKKLWFEQRVLEMLKSVWKHPLINEYDRLLKKFKHLKS